MTTADQLARLTDAVTALRDEYADDGAAVFNGLQVADSLDDLLRTALHGEHLEVAS